MSNIPIAVEMNTKKEHSFLRMIATQPVTNARIPAAMPDVSGLEVLRFVRREPGLQQIPVVIVSARTPPADIRTGFEEGATAYLTKSVDVNKLRETVARVIEDPGFDPKMDVAE